MLWSACCPDAPDGLYFVACGEVTLHQLPPPGVDDRFSSEATDGPPSPYKAPISPALITRRVAAAPSRVTGAPSSTATAIYPETAPLLDSPRTTSRNKHNQGKLLDSSQPSHQIHARGRFLKILRGGLFGELDYFTQQPRKYYATATSKLGASLWSALHSLFVCLFVCVCVRLGVFMCCMLG